MVAARRSAPLARASRESPITAAASASPNSTSEGTPVSAAICTKVLCEARGGPALGRALSIGARPFVVTGVAPRGFAFPNEDVDVWLRLHAVPGVAIFNRIDARNYHLVARLRAGDPALPAARLQPAGAVFWFADRAAAATPAFSGR